MPATNAKTQDDGDGEVPLASSAGAGRAESAGLGESSGWVDFGADFAPGLAFALALVFDDVLVVAVLGLVSGSVDFNLMRGGIDAVTGVQ